MKYRIVERVDGKFEIQNRKFFRWKCVDTCQNLQEAQYAIEYIIENNKEQKEYEEGRKPKKVIQEFDV